MYYLHSESIFTPLFWSRKYLNTNSMAISWLQGSIIMSGFTLHKYDINKHFIITNRCKYAQGDTMFIVRKKKFAKIKRIMIFWTPYVYICLISGKGKINNSFYGIFISINFISMFRKLLKFATIFTIPRLRKSVTQNAIML